MEGPVALRKRKCPRQRKVGNPILEFVIEGGHDYDFDGDAVAGV
jgi:hypothetical protein